MIWVAWRHYRLMMISGLLLLAGAAIYLVLTGLQQLDLFNELGLSGGSAAADKISSFLNSYGTLDTIVTYLTLIPVLWGILMAIPVILELEHRTYRLSWTQSITRRRWFWMMLGMALAGVLVFSGVFSALLSWWYAPRVQFQDPFGATFYRGGVVPLAYGVFALALALVVGAFTRKSAIALLSALVISLVVILSLAGTVRAHYLPPVQYIGPATGTLEVPQIPERAWIISLDFIDGDGNKVSNDKLNEILSGAPIEKDIEKSLISPGIRGSVLIQSAERFWLFQTIDISIFLVASILMLGFTYWGITRRI